VNEDEIEEDYDFGENDDSIVDNSNNVMFKCIHLFASTV